MTAQAGEKGFFGALFDFSFTNFVTLKLVKFLFALGLLGGVLGAIFLLVASFAQGTQSGLIALAGVPLGLALFTIYLRVILETLVVLFRIAENTGEIARQGRQP